jgi:hypothetical protein
MCACIHCLASCDRVCKRSSLFLFSDDALSPHTHTYLYIHTRTQVPMLGSPHTIYKYTHYVKIDQLLCKDSLDPPSRLQFHTHELRKKQGGGSPTSQRGLYLFHNIHIDNILVSRHNGGQNYINRILVQAGFVPRVSTE